ncbi:MAG TPA: hypothetical protein VJ930_10700 [Acidimicrobiia bacterium]|nr:hypothetical protein [Acidimicrobiia bacterium]
MHRRFARVDDRYPVVLGIDGMRQQSVDDSVVGIGDRADQARESLPPDPNVDPKKTGPREVRSLVEIIVPDDRGEIGPVLFGVEGEEGSSLDGHDVGIGPVVADELDHRFVVWSGFGDLVAHRSLAVGITCLMASHRTH